MNTTQPCIVSTWRHGKEANRAGMEVLRAGGSAIDAVEAAVRTAESDPEVRSVGFGGFPDREGRVTLDAAIMDHDFHCGAVAALEGFVHAISVARAVMEHTPHVLLAGAGAREFAIERGFSKTRLITASTLDIYEREHEGASAPTANIENRSIGGSADATTGEPVSHDTISTIAIDSAGRLAAACTTSGLGGRLHGRVGDSPIVGAGVYVDGEVGAAAATGLGEIALRVSASSMVVDRMRGGASPHAAAEATIDFIRRRLRPPVDQQLAVIALSVSGEVGWAALLPGFTCEVTGP